MTINQMTVSELIDALKAAQCGHSDRPVIIATPENHHGDNQLFNVTGVMFDYLTNRVELSVEEICP